MFVKVIWGEIWDWQNILHTYSRTHSGMPRQTLFWHSMVHWAVTAQCIEQETRLLVGRQRQWTCSLDPYDIWNMCHSFWFSVMVFGIVSCYILWISKAFPYSSCTETPSAGTYGLQTVLLHFMSFNLYIVALKSHGHGCHICHRF